VDPAGALLDDLAGHAEVTVTIGAGEEHGEHGATSLEVGGDGRTVVYSRAHGKERTFEGRLDPDRVAELGHELARLGLTSLRPRPGDRQPGDAPVWVEVKRAGETLHEQALWHGDRHVDPGLDGVLVRYQQIVEEVTNGELPFGAA
jgi:hypothetical protein